MDRLNERLTIARQALATFCEVLAEPKSAVTRDAAIKRFEYTFETAWRAAQLYLREKHGMERPSPKVVLRGCGEAGLLGERQVEMALQMTNDRNRTAHTYNEKLAEEILNRLPAYSELVAELLQKMSDAVAGF